MREQSGKSEVKIISKEMET